MRKVKYGIIYISIFVVLILASGTVSAADITVNPGGSIQTAINQASNNDVVILNDNNGAAYTYTENVVIGKDLTLKSDGSVTVQALNTSKPVFTINSGGSGSTITGLTISGATRSSGIRLNSANNCIIASNDISNNNIGVYVYHSCENTITANSISSSYIGLWLISSSNNNLISRNTVSNDDSGLYFDGSNDNQVLENSITNNTLGLYLFESVGTEVHFNRIFANQHGVLSDLGSYTTYAQNNWWGHNNPIVSSNPGDIRMDDGVVSYNPWLVLNVSAGPTSLNVGGSSSVTTDLTHNNQGCDTSSSGHVPDGLPVNFTTNLGTVNSPVYIRNGKATTVFGSGSSSGVAHLQGIVDSQSVQTDITVVANNNTPTVTNVYPQNGMLIGSADVEYESVLIAFSEPIQAGPAYNNIKIVGQDYNGLNSKNININRSISGSGLTLTPDSFWASGDYTVTVPVNSIRNMAGNGLATAFTLNFRADTTPPTVTATPAGGTYAGAQVVTLTATDNLDPSPHIRYSTNGGVPNTTYTGPINITNTTTLKFIAWDDTGNIRPLQTMVYNIGTADTTLPTVYASPAGGTYSSAQMVYLTATDSLDPNPAIYYTLNGSTPTTSSSRYTGPISVGCSVSLSFMAVDASGNVSTVQSQYYTIYANNSGVATLTVTSNALDASTGHEVVVGSETVTESKVFNWYRLAKLLAGPVGNVSALTSYLDMTHGYGETLMADVPPLSESEVKNLIFEHLYDFPSNGGWWGDETIKQFVGDWGLLSEYEQEIKQNYQSWSEVDKLYNLMWNDVDGCTVQTPLSNDYTDEIWLNRIWNAGNDPSVPFPNTLPYVPVRWVETTTMTVPVTEMQYSPLNVSYQIPLSGSVDDVSVVFKQQNVSFDLAEKMEVWVNGQLLLTKTFFNYYCPTYNTYYQTHNIPVGAVCEDNVNVTLNYPGGTITKNEQITYMDDISSASDINHPETAFECIQSFAIANTRVTDNMVQSWLYQSSQFPVGYKKAMYGTFMTALTTLWLSDKLADEIAPQLNVTWNRNTTTAVMAGVNNNGTAYVHTPDAGMGMSVTGGVIDVKNFRFACSLLLSEVEHGAIGATGLSVDSSVSRIISGILNGETFDMIRNGSMVIIMLDGDPNYKIVIDTSTGLVWDLTISNGFQYKGAVSQNTAYCYHDQLTNDILGQVSNWLQNLSGGSNVLSALGGAINGTQQFVVDNWNHIVDIGFGLFELGFGIKTIPTMGIAGPIAIGLILKGEGDIIVGIRNWLVPGNYWQYCSYHNPWPNYKTVSRLNNTTHMIDSIEVPIKDGKEDWDNAVYINAQNGVMT